MAILNIPCRYCSHHEQVRKHGVSNSGHQRYRCSDCKKTFQLTYTYNACLPGIKERIVEMAMNNAGIRDTARVLEISKDTVLSILKN